MFIIATVVVCIGSSSDEFSTYTSTINWRSSTPEQQSIDSEQLAKAFDYVKEGDINIHSLMLIRNGFLILEAYFYPNSKGIVHGVTSATKSISSILIGIAIAKDFINSVNQSVLHLFPNQKIANLEDWKKRLTIGHSTCSVSQC